MEQTLVILVVLFFLVGLVFGSFLNMLVYRVHRGLPILGRSFCDKTKKQLKPIDLIPVLSYVLFKGKCRDCGTRLPLLYPAVELLTGALSLIALVMAWNYAGAEQLGSLFLAWGISFSFFLIMLYFGYYDLLHWEIDARSVYITLGYLILLNIVNHFFPLPFFYDSISHLIGGLTLGGIILLVYKLSKGGGMGEGDIYLFAMTGLMLGWQVGIIAMVLTSVLGSLVGIVVAMQKKKLHGLRIQLAPFIALGTILAYIFKDILFVFFFEGFYY